MKRLMLTLFAFSSLICGAQTSKSTSEENLLNKILTDPAPREIKNILGDLRKQDLSPREVVVHDSVLLSNLNTLYVLSHKVEGLIHYGAVIVPANTNEKKLPVIVFASGGDGMHKELDIRQDFNHAAVQFPDFLGDELDSMLIVVIPSFRGQQLIIGDKKYQSDGNVGDAFGGATTDALAFLNVVLKTFAQASV